MSPLQSDWPGHVAARLVPTPSPVVSLSLALYLTRNFDISAGRSYHVFTASSWGSFPFKSWILEIAGSNFKTWLIQPISTLQNHRTCSLLKVKPGLWPLLPHQPLFLHRIAPLARGFCGWKIRRWGTMYKRRVNYTYLACVISSC